MYRIYKMFPIIIFILTMWVFLERETKEQKCTEKCFPRKQVTPRIVEDTYMELGVGSIPFYTMEIFADCLC